MQKRFAKPLTTLALLACSTPLFAAKIALSPAEGTRLWLEGNSTLHPFSSTATALTATMSLDADAATPAAELAAITAHHPATLTVTVPVDGLKSAHKGLDKNMRSSLKSGKFPDITFLLDNYTPAQGAQALSASGALTVAGETKQVVVNVTLAAKENRLVIDGAQPLLMTDFGIKPPTMFLGALKTENRVMVRFHLEMEPAVGGTKAEAK